MNRKPLFFLLLVLSVLISSCSQYQKLLKSSDNDLKYTEALKHYEKGDYLKAQQLFEQIQPFFKGTDKAEKIAFYSAYCYYKQEDYILGSFYFKAFATNFSTSPYAEEAAYMSAYCNYLDSPRSSLDPTNTLEAITSLQLFINQYPKSERIEKCNNLITELRAKLEKKAIDIALLYYKMDDYKASIVALNNVLKDFPDTKEKEMVLYSLMQTKYQYAIKSIPEKRHDRMTEALDAFDEYIAGFPKGQYSKDALVIKKEIAKELGN